MPNQVKQTKEVTSNHADMFSKAKVFAQKKHASQLDDTGKDYFVAHCMPVALMLCAVSEDQDLRVAALLHDTLEDTDTTYDELCEKFNKRVADIVDEVTHEGDKTLGYYFPRLHSKEGIMLKLADRLSNISRMESWDEKRQQHYLKRTKFWKTYEGEQL